MSFLSATTARPTVLSGAVWSLACAGACACAELERDTGGDEAEDAAAATPSGPPAVGGQFVPPPSLDASMGVEVGTPPTLDARVPSAPPSGGACTPGLCLQCDAAGRGIVPPDDESCPRVDCTALDTFGLAEVDGVQVCQRQVHLPSGNRCEGPGRCRMTADARTCGDVRPVEQSRAESVCQTISGCAGAEPPMLGPAPTGTSCGDAGLCRPNGMCDTSVAERCRPFAGAAVCDAGTDVNGDDYCEIAAAGSNCVTACQAFQRACLGAFVASAEEPCVQGEPVGCLAEQPNLRCRCFNE